MPFKSIDKRREYQRITRQTRRKEYFSDKVCADCGSKERLQLHHVDKDTKIDSWIWHWSLERRVIELAKCIVLCASCHSKRHNKEKNIFVKKQMKHGTSYAYNKYKCRCDLCKSFTSARMRKYNKV